jgi:hypothetical protein
MAIEALPLARSSVVETNPATHIAYLESLEATAKEHAGAGADDIALMLRNHAYDPIYTDPADEITLAVMDAQLARGETAEGSSRFAEISPNMRPRGVIILLKHGVQPQGWQTANYRLEDSWHQYSLRQQGEVITDLLAMGEYRCAAHFANLMTPANSVPEQRSAQRETIISIAHHQAEFGGDPQAGIDTLLALQQEAEAALNTIIEERMRLPEYAANEAEAATLADVTARYDEYTDTYNRCDIHIITLRAQQSESLGAQLLERAAFYDDDTLHYRKRAKLALKATLADLRIYEPAPRLAQPVEQTPVERNLLARASTVALSGARRAADWVRRLRGLQAVRP